GLGATVFPYTTLFRSILSIDIADVDVGENVGAKLQAEQAEANKLIAQAQAEVRRAAAVALEQEMSARVEEMRARVTEAEAQVPRSEEHTSELQSRENL